MTSNEMSFSEKNNLTISTAVGLGDPAYFQQLQITTTYGKPNGGTNIVQGIIDRQIAQKNQIADSSQLEERNMIHEGPVIENVFSIPTDKPSSSAVNKNKAVSSIKKSQKRTSSNKAVEPRTSKRARKSQKEISCENIINTYDNKILFNLLSNRLDAQTILQKYKEKTIKWSETKLQKQVLGVLNVTLSTSSSSDPLNSNAKTSHKSSNSNAKISNNSSNLDAKTSILQNILIGLSNLAGANFIDVILNTFGDDLTVVDKVLEYMNIDVLIGALRNKFTTTELLDTFKINKEQILKTVPAEAILNAVQSRDDLKTSMPLLQLLLKAFSQIDPKKINQNTEDVCVKSELDVELINAIVSLIKSRKYLNGSEVLYNHMLQNGPNKLSDKSILIIKNVLTDKFSPPKLVKLLNKAIHACMARDNNGIIEIDSDSDLD